MLIIDGVDAPAAPSSDEDEDVEMSASNAGDGMNQRLKELRKTLGLSQQEFSERINVAQSTYAQICNTFSVSEKWLRTGEGEMLVKESDLYDEKLIIYYNLRDSRQVSYIEAIGASSEIENLLPVRDNKKSAVECSTADENGGA